MPRILITAFEPYDRWPENSSWLTLIEFTKQLDRSANVTTRLYPVDLTAVQQRLQSDLASGYDVALHLGQAPGAAKVRLEAIGVNVGMESSGCSHDYRPLVPDGPAAYRSELPLARWVEVLRTAGIPAAISYHAGTYLCNATLYLSHFVRDRLGLRTQAAFIHLPLDISQAAREDQEVPALPAAVCAEALRMIVGEILKAAQAGDPALVGQPHRPDVT